jgi:hypothetical protein
MGPHFGISDNGEQCIHGRRSIEKTMSHNNRELKVKRNGCSLQTLLNQTTTNTGNARAMRNDSCSRAHAGDRGKLRFASVGGNDNHK